MEEKMLHFLPIKNPNCWAKVLPAIAFPNAPWKHKKTTASTVLQKGKQKGVTQPIIYMDVDMG